MADIFDEISGDLRAERAMSLLKRYAVLLALAIVLAVVGVGVWQGLRWQARQQAEQAAATFNDAVRRSTVPPATDGADTSREEAARALAGLAASGPPGYQTLARLRGASLHAAMNDMPGALALWDQVSADTQADPLLRGLADLMWVQHQVDQGDPAAIQGRLAPLLAPANPWRPLALECQAWLLLRTGEQDRARDILKQLRAEELAPAAVRTRASILLSNLGEPPLPRTELGQ